MLQTCRREIVKRGFSEEGGSANGLCDTASTGTAEEEEEDGEAAAGERERAQA